MRQRIANFKTHHMSLVMVFLGPRLETAIGTWFVEWIGKLTAAVKSQSVFTGFTHFSEHRTEKTGLRQGQNDDRERERVE